MDYIDLTIMNLLEMFKTIFKGYLPQGNSQKEKKGEEMDLKEPRLLGQTGLKVGRLGVAGGYNGPAEAFEEAFDHGCNYFYWSSPRKSGMGQAIKNICSRGEREELVIVLQSYNRLASLVETSLKKGLKDLGQDYVDVLLLGWYNKPPSRRLMDKALALKEKGLCRFLGISGHNRQLFPELARQGFFDLFHTRYNAAHKGAETEVFAPLKDTVRPGIVTYTATRWGRLLNPKKMPPNQAPPQASDCYRFVLSHPMVDVCMCGPKNREQMQEALRTLELGPLSDEEMKRMRMIGDYVHDKSAKFL